MLEQFCTIEPLSSFTEFWIFGTPNLARPKLILKMSQQYTKLFALQNIDMTPLEQLSICEFPVRLISRSTQEVEMQQANHRSSPTSTQGKPPFLPRHIWAQIGHKCLSPAPLSSWSLSALGLWRTIKSKMFFSAHVFGGESILWRQLFLFTLQHFIFPTSCNYSHFLITAGSGRAFSEVQTDSKNSNNNNNQLILPW